MDVMSLKGKKMSRNYDCWVEPEKNEDIKGLSKDTLKLMLSYCGNITLYGGESEQEYATRIIKKLWEKEGRYINFRIQMTYLEDLPYQDYTFDEDEYSEIMEKYDD